MPSIRTITNELSKLKKLRSKAKSKLDRSTSMESAKQYTARIRELDLKIEALRNSK